MGQRCPFIYQVGQTLSCHTHVYFDKATQTEKVTAQFFFLSKIYGFKLSNLHKEKSFEETISNPED
jgi:hypothetical protein